MTGQVVRPFWLLVPVVAVGAALVGALLIFFGSAELAEVVELGERGLGVGVVLIIGGFVTVVGALVAGLVIGATRSRDIRRPGEAVRPGLVVAGFWTLAYLVAAAAVWLS